MNHNIQKIYNSVGNDNEFLLDGQSDVILIGCCQKPKFPNVFQMIFTKKNEKEPESVATEMGQEHISHEVLGHFGVVGLFFELFSKFVDKDNPTIKLDFFTNTFEKMKGALNTHVFSQINPNLALLSQNDVKEKIASKNSSTKSEPKEIKTISAHKNLWLGNPSKHPNYIPNKLTPPSPSFLGNKTKKK